MSLPRYSDLPRPPGETLPLAWNLWQAGDQVGMWNNVTPQVVVEAARLIRSGRRFNLNLPLHIPLGLLPDGAHAVRRGPIHTIYRFDGSEVMGMDDKLEFHPQASTQWDGLTHVGDGRHGFYNGVQPRDVTQKDGTPNGIDKIAEFGIATRAVLVDLPSHFQSTGRNWRVDGSEIATAADIAACLARTGQSLKPGDVLLVRTGWLEAFRGAHEATRYKLFHGRDYSGLSGAEDMWEFLWDHRVAAVASDSVTVEVFPMAPGKPSLHLAIARLGLTLGELFDLDDLARYAIASKTYDFFFAAMPLNVRGGVGSPANAIAIA